MTRLRSSTCRSRTIASCYLIAGIQWIIHMSQSSSCMSFQLLDTTVMCIRSDLLSSQLEHCNHKNQQFYLDSHLSRNTRSRGRKMSVTWANRKSNNDYYSDDDDDNMDDSDNNWIDDTLRGRGKKRTKTIDNYEDEIDDDIYDDDDDEEYDDYDDEFIKNEYELLGNELIPNPLLDSIDPDGAAERFPELAQDPKFWFEMLLFVAFLDFVSYAGPRNPFPDSPIW
jgi:hypothetical protein